MYKQETGEPFAGLMVFYLYKRNVIKQLSMNPFEKKGDQLQLTEENENVYA